MKTGVFMRLLLAQILEQLARDPKSLELASAKLCGVMKSDDSDEAWDRMEMLDIAGEAVPVMIDQAGDVTGLSDALLDELTFIRDSIVPERDQATLCLNTGVPEVTTNGTKVIVKIGARLRLLYSYGTLVAVLRGDVFYITTHRYSATTTKHINEFLWMHSGCSEQKDVTPKRLAELATVTTGTEFE